jgi:hypothetical protein
MHKKPLTLHLEPNNTIMIAFRNFLIYATLGMLLCVPFYSYADFSPYVPLSPLPLTTPSTCDPSNPTAETCRTDIEQYLPGIFRLLIASAGALAVIMIVIGGIQYLSTDAISGKSEGKELITNALVGLMLVIGSWILLNTINPKTLEVNLSLQRPVSTIPSATSTTGGPTPPAEMCLRNVGGTTTSVACECFNCTDITMGGHSSLPLKPNQGTMLNQNLANNLLEVNQTMNSASFGWEITEVWKPTVGHANECHIRGTCADANLLVIRALPDGGRITPANASTVVPAILTFFNANYTAGVRAELEVRTQAEATALRNAGVPFPPTSHPNLFIIKVVPQITATHFSLYPL